MVKLMRFHIHTLVTEDIKFYMYCLNSYGQIIRLEDWVPLFFQWHQGSFYGSLIKQADPPEEYQDFLQKEYYLDMDGILLNPYDALELFGTETFNPYVEWELDDFSQTLMAIAPILYEQMEKQNFRPNFTKWKESGEFSWQVPEIVWQEFLPEFWDEKIDARYDSRERTIRKFVEEWFHQSIETYIARDPEVFSKWQERKKVLNELLQNGIHVEAIFEHTEFIKWIGLADQTSPLVLGLRLEEPHEDGEFWHLETVLRDRKKENSWVPFVDGKKLPKKWSNHVEEIEAKQKQIVHLIPWLANEDYLISLDEEDERAVVGVQEGLRNTSVDETSRHTSSANGRIKAKNSRHHLKTVPLSPIKKELTEDEAWEFLTNASQVLFMLGFEILLPSWWESVKDANLKLKARVASTSAAPSFVGLNALMDFEWRIAVNDVELTEEEFRQLVEDKRRFLQISGRWVKLDPAFIKQIQTLMEKAEKQGMRVQDLIEQQLLYRFESEKDFDQQNDEDNDPNIFSRIQIELHPRLEHFVKKLADITDLPEMPVPKKLHGELRPYQIKGMSWLYFLRQYGFGACLADDMGLGKTIQFIAYLLLVKENNPDVPPALIICPTSVLGNWQREIERFAPDLHVYLHYGPHRAKGEDFVKKVLGDAVLSENDASAGSGADQQHLLKLSSYPNDVENSSLAEAEIGASSGVEHEVYDGWNLSESERDQRVQNGADETEDDSTDEFYFAKKDANHENQHKKIDIVLTTYGLSHLDFAELSSINWGTIALDEAQNIKNPQTKQSRSIRKLRGAHHIALTGTPMENRLTELWSIFDFINKGYLGSLSSFQKRFAYPIERERNEKKIEALRKLIRPFLLRRTKNDEEVALNLPDKLEQKEYCPLTPEQGALYEQLINETMEKIAELSGFERKGYVLTLLNKLKQLCNHPALYLKETGDLLSGEDGVYSEKQLISRSAKLKKLVELFDMIIEQDERGLIFTQYIRMGEIIKTVLEKRYQIEIPFLNGSLNKKQRDEMIENFQQGKYPIFLLSLKAGGTGLNLTAANHVIHYDRWWNPAVENQATDRAYRIGQTKFVHVHKFITTGTLEEKIDQILERKQSLNEEIIQSDQWIADLSDEELYDIIKLERV